MNSVAGNPNYTQPNGFDPKGVRGRHPLRFIVGGVKALDEALRHGANDVIVVKR